MGNSYLLESTLRFLERNYAWTRIENVDRTNELLVGENLESDGFGERYFTRVQAYTVGYEREVGHIPHLSTALGGQFTWYGVPEKLKATYGEHPVGGIFVPSSASTLSAMTITNHVHPDALVRVGECSSPGTGRDMARCLSGELRSAGRTRVFASTWAGSGARAPGTSRFLFPP